MVNNLLADSVDAVFPEHVAVPVKQLHSACSTNWKFLGCIQSCLETVRKKQAIVEQIGHGTLRLVRSRRPFVNGVALVIHQVSAIRINQLVGRIMDQGITVKGAVILARQNIPVISTSKLFIRICMAMPPDHQDPRVHQGRPDHQDPGSTRAARTGRWGAGRLRIVQTKFVTTDNPVVIMIKTLMFYWHWQSPQRKYAGPRHPQ